MEPREVQRQPRARSGVGPDTWVIAAWWLVVVTLGFLRWDWTGDGVRHLFAIVDGSGPLVGEPRWVLFPAFLYALLRPFVVLGLATSGAALARVMMGLTVLAAGAYMVALRACLVTAGVEPRRRAAALALAGATAGLLLLSTDLMEPLFGAALVVVALAWAGRRVSRLDATPVDRRRALVVTVAVIAFASLLYQGLVLALGLLPLVFPRETLRDRRALLQAALVLAVIPVVMVGTLMLTGDGLAHAVKRAVQGEENPLYRNFLTKDGSGARLGARVVAIVGGPPQGFVVLTNFHGFNGLIAGLRGHGNRADALATLARLALGGAIVLAGLVAAIRRRDRAVLIAFAALMVLPIVRCQQYGYLKFYVFLPVIAAFAAARARPLVVGALAAALVWFNVSPLGQVGRVRASSRAHREVAAAYQQAGPRSCWMTTAWVPPYWIEWPGRACGVLNELAHGHGQTETEVIAQSHVALTTCLDACFCGSEGVYMDDMTDPAPLVDLARHFQYTSFDVGTLAVSAARADRLSAGFYRYPAEDQRRICESLTRARSGAR
jgi:hypothetical protein